MSFEDNMIDDGFYDAQDYMDYLMNKANDDADERDRRESFCRDDDEDDFLDYMN